MIYTLAWRNIWRNKKRTSLLICSIILGLMALFMAVSFVNGLTSSFIDNAINTEFSHIQIHHSEYEQDYNPIFTVQNEDSLTKCLLSNNKIQSFTCRAKINGLATSPKSSRGISIIGIDPEKEAMVTGLNTFISEGSYFLGDIKRPLLIGRKLADQLKVKVKSKILLTYLNSNNEISAESFRIAAILETSSARLNGAYVFIRKRDFYNAFNRENISHEIAIKLKSEPEVMSVSQEIKKVAGNNKVETWKEIAPDLEASVNKTKVDKMIVMVVIILAFSFGLINTMLMQVNERTREIGMLIANGMKRSKVFMLVILESLFSVALASAVGILAGFILVTYLNRTGMDFSNMAEAFANNGWSKIVHPVLYKIDYIQVAIASILSGFIGAVLPASKTLKLDVITSIRKV